MYELPIDIYTQPEPITIGKGPRSFSLRVRRYTPPERMAIIDAIRVPSLAEAQAIAQKAVQGWDGITNKGGTPVPVAGTDVQTGEPVNNIERVIGAMHISVQAEVLAALLAFAGLPREVFQDLVDSLSRSTGYSIDADPTGLPPNETPGGGSTKSSTIAT